MLHLPGCDYIWLKHFWKEKEYTKSISRKKPFNLVIFVLLQGWIRGTFYSSCQVIFQTAVDIHRIMGWARNMQKTSISFFVQMQINRNLHSVLQHPGCATARLPFPNCWRHARQFRAVSLCCSNPCTQTSRLWPSGDVSYPATVFCYS